MEASLPHIRIWRGDITTLHVDAVVNAANTMLRSGGGVDGAIHQAAGRDLLAYLSEHYPQGCAVGEAVYSPAFKMPCKMLIHTVGPTWSGGGFGEPGLLASCYASSMQLARAKGALSIAFPAISCGVYGYPPALAAAVAVAEIRAFLSTEPRMHVKLVALDDTMQEVLHSALTPLTNTHP